MAIPRLQLDDQLPDAHGLTEAPERRQAGPHANRFTARPHRSPVSAQAPLQAPTPLDSHGATLAQRLRVYERFEGVLLDRLFHVNSQPLIGDVSKRSRFLRHRASARETSPDPQGGGNGERMSPNIHCVALKPGPGMLVRQKCGDWPP